MCLSKCQEAPTKVGFLKILQRSLVLFLCGRLSSTALPFLSYFTCLVPLIPLTLLYRHILSSSPIVPYLFPGLCKHSKWNSVSDYYKIAPINEKIRDICLSGLTSLGIIVLHLSIHLWISYFFCSWIISCWANAPRFHYPLMVIYDSSTFWLLWAEQQGAQMGSVSMAGEGVRPRTVELDRVCIYF